MKKLILTALTALAIIAAPTSEARDTDRNTIASELKQTDYASLLKKYQAAEALDAGQYRTLYYGAALQPGFAADRQYTAIDNAYAASDMATTLRLCEEALASDPTNLALLFKAYVAAATSSDPAAKAKATTFQNHILGLCDAIFSSADGVTETSPYVVTRKSDIDEFLLKYIQPETVVGRARIGNLEAAKVRINGINDDVIFYFSIL